MKKRYDNWYGRKAMTASSLRCLQKRSSGVKRDITQGDSMTSGQGWEAGKGGATTERAGTHKVESVQEFHVSFSTHTAAKTGMTMVSGWEG
jgi:hypothetical protein